MAAATPKTEGAPKKTRKSFTRTEKPIYAVVSYTDNGESVKLDKASLSIKLERDPAKIMEAMEAGLGNSVFVKLDMPKADKPVATDAPVADATVPA